MTLPRSSEGIGKRLAKYRKLAGLSAQQLSDKIWGEMSRAVIANIESGRKSDITIDQLLAIAWALDIPPLALAVSAETPFERISIVNGDEDAVLPIYDLVAWLTNSESLQDVAMVPPDVQQAAAILAQVTLVASATLSSNMHHLRLLERLRAVGQPASADRVNELRDGIQGTLKEMMGAKMNMDMAPDDSSWDKRFARLSDLPGSSHGDD